MFIFLIKEIRMKKGITQEELSRRTGITQNYLSELENNRKKNPSFETVLKISLALGEEIRKIYIATSDIENLKKKMNELIDEKGIDSEEVLRMSKLIDRLVLLKME